MYFSKPGPDCTEETVRIAIEAARERGIRHVVVASNTGRTAWRLQSLLPDVNVVVVTHAYGYAGPGKIELADEERGRLLAAGFRVYTGTHILSGIERGMRASYGGLGPAETIAYTLRMFGQGTKVCVECSAMAMDGGCIPHGVDVLAIGGSGSGADTAVILRPAHAANVLSTKIREFLCKPAIF